MTILGATGSIGTSCLDVVRAHPDQFSIFALTANASWQALAKQCQEFAPKFAVLTGLTSDQVPRDAFPSSTTLLFGEAAIERVVTDDEVNFVVSAIVGAAGLLGTWAAVNVGKDVGLANKESLVVAGPLMMKRAAETGSRLLPVDSEHSAIFQALDCGRRNEVRKVILTASGGPFRTKSLADLDSVTPADALSHPTWDMGPKITIDSATMMNKALEVIEARWLFDLSIDEIDVVVHPQSIVHSMVEFIDGSVMAQLSPPDMKLPIQYAMTWPHRANGVSPRLDLTTAFALDFEPPNLDKFPALALGLEVARSGGTSGAVLNAANEVAVERFLGSTLSFTDIPRLCRSILASHDHLSAPSLDDLLSLDAWARQEAFRWTYSQSPSSLPLTRSRS